MAIPTNMPALQLVGRDGNAYFILGRAQVAARRAGWSADEIKEFNNEAMSSDYAHLLQTCATYFDVDGEDEDDFAQDDDDNPYPFGEED